MHLASQFYNENADTLVARYESVNFRDLYPYLNEVLSKQGLRILEVGAGSGRDAGYMASLGHNIVAIEPAPKMLAFAKERHGSTRISWISVPFPQVDLTGLYFDLVLLHAVWFHISPGQRMFAMEKVAHCLASKGKAYISLRHGIPDPQRHMHEASEEELMRLSQFAGLQCRKLDEYQDALQRQDVHWSVYELWR